MENVSAGLDPRHVKTEICEPEPALKIVAEQRNKVTRWTDGEDGRSVEKNKTLRMHANCINESQLFRSVVPSSPFMLYPPPEYLPWLLRTLHV